MSELGSGILIGILALALVAAGALAGWVLWRQQRQTQAVEQRLVRLETGLTAALGVMTSLKQRLDQQEKRQLALDRRLDPLHRQLEEMASSQRAARPYDEAIRLVRQGASAQRLVDELGLSSSEAELLIMLHGQDKSRSAH